MSKLKHRLEPNSHLPFKGEKTEFIRKAKDRKCYGYTFDPRDGHHPLSLAVDFFLQDGTRMGIFYMEVQSPILFSLGGTQTPQSITLRTTGAEIVIYGKRLSPIYEYLLEQRLVWLKEPDGSFTEVKENEAEIEEVIIKVRGKLN